MDNVESADGVGKAVAKLVISMYDSLPQRGKPADDEWTVAASVVAQFSDLSLKIVSLATGTKCLGSSERSPKLVNDSHAEVLAKRLLIHELFKDIESTYLGNKSSYFRLDEFNLCELKEGVTFYLYISQLPCGDAVIFDREPADSLSKTNSCEQSSEVINDIHRTGAKPVSGGPQDRKLPGKAYHELRTLRTKPGRGIATKSMSCSDKISRWVACGLQSKLLSVLLSKPITLNGLVIGGSVFDHSALTRALIDRHGSPLQTVHLYNEPSIYFAHCKTVKRLRPSATSILYNGRCLEVGVDGRRQGVTKKVLGTDKAQLSICRKQMFGMFRQVVSCIIDSGNAPACITNVALCSYFQCKSQCAPFHNVLRKRFDSKMVHWVLKDDEDFTVLT